MAGKESFNDHKAHLMKMTTGRNISRLRRWNAPNRNYIRGMIDHE